MGDNATVLRWNGAFWTPLPTGLTTWPSLRAVWARSDDDLWVVGDDGTVLRGGATGLKPFLVPEVAGIPLLSVSGTSERGRATVWIGALSTLFRYDEGVVSRQSLSGTTTGALFVQSAQEAWTAGLSCQVIHQTPEQTRAELIPACGLDQLTSLAGYGDRLWVTGYTIPAAGVIYERRDGQYRTAARLPGDARGACSSPWTACAAAAGPPAAPRR